MKRGKMVAKANPLTAEQAQLLTLLAVGVSVEDLYRYVTIPSERIPEIVDLLHTNLAIPERDETWAALHARALKWKSLTDTTVMARAAVAALAVDPRPAVYQEA